MDNQIIVTIDTDGVIRNFVQQATKYINKYVKVKPNFEGNYSLEDAYNLPKGFIHDVLFNKHPKEVFLKALPYRGAIDCIKKLHSKFKIIIATSQQEQTGIMPTMQWYENQGLLKFSDIDFMFVRNKNIIRCNVLIEDSPNQIRAAVETYNQYGYPQLIICIRRPWNIDISNDKNIAVIDEFTYSKVMNAIKENSEKLLC